MDSPSGGWPPPWQDRRVAAPDEPLAESVFVRATRGERCARLPVWFMRQAGRSLPEYRAVRSGVSMLEACSRPELITEITLQPVRRYGVDAAILFSDIVLPLKAMGVDLDIVPGVGPVIAKPVTDLQGVDRIPPLEASSVEFVTAAVRALTSELGGTPLIGFAGAPYTLASYLIEGGPSKDHAKTKSLMYGAPDVWAVLLERLAQVAGEFLRVQAEAGVAAVQVFDSWAGSLAPADYRAFVLPYTARVFAAVADLEVPRIHFGVGTGELLADMATAGVEVMGVDWRVPLDRAVDRLPAGQVVQGNLDPTALFAPWGVVERQAHSVIEAGLSAKAHIFNLGHGVLPSTDPDQVSRLVDYIHAYEVEPTT